MYERSPVFRAASQQPQRYRSLLMGVEWWLPLSEGPAVFAAPRPTGQRTRMGRVDQLLTQLRMLADRTGVFAGADPRAVRRDGPPDEPQAAAAGRFGLAVMLELTERAHQQRQPLLMDY